MAVQCLLFVWTNTGDEELIFMNGKNPVRRALTQAAPRDPMRHDDSPAIPDGTPTLTVHHISRPPAQKSDDVYRVVESRFGAIIEAWFDSV